MSTAPKPGDKTLVLVECCSVLRVGDKVLSEKKTIFMRLIRSYDATKALRAQDDLALIKLADPDNNYELVEIDHIES
jgi:hypothetical protein